MNMVIIAILTSLSTWSYHLYNFGSIFVDWFFSSYGSNFPAFFAFQVSFDWMLNISYFVLLGAWNLLSSSEDGWTVFWYSVNSLAVQFHCYGVVFWGILLKLSRTSETSNSAGRNSDSSQPHVSSGDCASCSSWVILCPPSGVSLFHMFLSVLPLHTPWPSAYFWSSFSV